MTGFRGMLGLLGGLGQGYVEGKQQQTENDRQAALLALAQARDAREQQAFDRQRQEQQAVQAAGQAPAPQVDQQGGTMPATMDNADIGQPGEPTIQPTTYAAGGQTGMSASQAVDASRAADTPDAQAARQAQVLSQYDPARAAQLRESTLAVKNTQIDLANKQWDNDVSMARSKGLQGLVDFANETHADGQGGAVKSKAVVSPDGKTFSIVQVMPDGTEQPTKMPPLPNTQEGYDQLAFSMAKGVPIQSRILHWQQVRESDRKEAHDQALDRHYTDADRAALITAKAHADYYGKAGDAMLEKGDAALAKVQQGTLDKMSPDDKAEYADLKSKSGKLGEQLTKAQLDAATAGTPFDPKNPQLAPLFEQRAVYERRMQQLYNNYREGSSPLSDPIGIRNNNPGNLKPGGRFANFPTMQDGIDYTDANLQKYAKMGDDSVRKVIARWAPPSENNTDAYVSAVAKGLGVKPDEKIDLSSPLVRHLMASEIFKHENGLKAVVKPGKGTPQPAAAPAAGAPAAAAPAASKEPGVMDRVVGGLRSVDDAIGSSQKGIAKFADSLQVPVAQMEKRLREAQSGGAPLTAQETTTAKQLGLI